ncbi:hybrid sensor histidine kinase/response regulator [Malaciobacter molluscorum LMG 25693]|uniref:histidine kinase n=1 Tax=Malaciobacter molluscorum LMG 25693 TaxID=870501 RepID=A0A2G1DJT5_9BACT|nr:response regulator [Malaciobacter molluscorum]AXX91599.1 two-component system sensor histidine kinase/response regulator fusion protein [Malaciobacter molluscorum LMG 25693]PHO18606.1 hybrid sensor histidine kinase/response regulator [Malaciobacter molluscorum LMG 25693]
MNLKRLFMLLFILNTGLFILVVMVINRYQKSTNTLEQAYQMQYKSLVLAHELRQSSDDLTRMARTYVITGNPLFKKQYQTVLDIRNGVKPRPKRYNGIFWDFLTLDGSIATLDGKKIPLKELMKEANFPEEELNLLFTSQNESDDLTNLEHKAMNAIIGVFQDKNGNYTIKSKPNYKLARELMYSDEYHKAKIRIMKPLDKFYKMFETRTKAKVKEARVIVKKLEFYVTVIVLFSIIVFLLSFFIILFRIVQPLELLRVSMLRLSKNDMSVELDKDKYQDEIGDMIGAVDVFKDNTKKLITSEQKIKLSMQEATSANKAKSIFLVRMSHELRTPLNAIMGFSNLLKKSQNINEQERKNLTIIKKSANHLLNIINEILELSKIEAGKIEIVPKSFNFEELLKEIESIFEFRCESKGLKFKLIKSENLPSFIKVDELRLRQILINLLGNSIKFTKKGEISLYVYEQNKKLFFEVKDTGIGISKVNLKKIFKPFEQVKKDDYSQNGTGLGLSITKELISLMNGTIYVKSNLNKGSEFYFSISYEDSSNDEIDIKIDKSSIKSIQNQNFEKSILVVDDIKENRQLVTQILNQYEFKVFEASSGTEALELYEKNRIDLIFMDILMSDMNGLEAIKKIREDKNDRKIPIITLSANVFLEDRRKALKAGANDFLPKPFEEESILALLQKYLNVDVYLKEEVKQTSSHIEDLPIEFYEKLKEYSTLMRNEEILKILDTYLLNDSTKKVIIELLENFDYQQIINLCDSKLNKAV